MILLFVAYLTIPIKNCPIVKKLGSVWPSKRRTDDKWYKDPRSGGKPLRSKQRPGNAILGYFVVWKNPGGLFWPNIRVFYTSYSEKPTERTVMQNADAKDLVRTASDLLVTMVDVIRKPKKLSTNNLQDVIEILGTVQEILKIANDIEVNSE